MAQSIDGIETSFTWDQALQIPQVLATSDGTRSLYGLERLGVVADGAWHYPQHDALGSVRQWTDAAAAVLAAQAYSPFGVPRTALGPAPWGFTGEWHDPGGLVYLRARWYNPSWGRYTQVDPFPAALATPATRHAYAYGLNNPLLYRDPTGRYIFEIEPTDLYHVATPRVRSHYWYTQPGYHPKQPSDAEVIIAMTSPLWAAVMALGAEALLLDVGLPTAEAACSRLWQRIVPYGYDLWIRLADAFASSPRVRWMEHEMNRVEHIVRPEHAWDRLVKLSGRVVEDYGRIQPYLRHVMRGPERVREIAQTGLGPVVEFVRNVKGEEVVVRAIQLGRDAYQIVDAWVRTR